MAVDVLRTLKASLERIPGTYNAFAYGPFAENPEDPEKEIDIVVIGDPDLHEMDEIISQAEKEVGRPINVLSFTLKEFRQRIAVKDEMVLEVVKGPKVILIGREPV